VVGAAAIVAACDADQAGIYGSPPDWVGGADARVADTDADARGETSTADTHEAEATSDAVADATGAGAIDAPSDTD